MSKIKLIAPKQRCGTNMILGDVPEFHIPEDGVIEIDSSKLKVFLKLGFVTPTVVDDDEKSEEDKDDDAKSPTVDDEDKKTNTKKSESKKSSNKK